MRPKIHRYYSNLNFTVRQNCTIPALYRGSGMEAIKSPQRFLPGKDSLEAPQVSSVEAQ